jgi:DNA-directed RNA polymerase specialized sigma24 family protein
MMLAYSQRRLGYNEVARDAVSEALARTVKTIARMDDLGTLPEAWCFGILRNVVIDAQRRSYRERRIHATADPVSVDPSEMTTRPCVEPSVNSVTSNASSSSFASSRGCPANTWRRCWT